MELVRRPAHWHRSARRGVALVGVVVLSLVVIAVTAMLVRQTIAQTEATQDRSRAALVVDAVAQTRAVFDARLSVDPDFFYTELFYAERPRVCPVTGEVRAASGTPEVPVAWVSGCPNGWEYVPPGAGVTGFDPAAQLVTVQVTPPGPGSEDLVVRFSASGGGAAEHVEVTYTRRSVAHMTVYSQEPLNLGSWATPAVLPGVVYARQGGSLAATWPGPGTTVAGECGFSGSGGGVVKFAPGSADERWAAGCPANLGTGYQEVRTLAAAPLSAADLNRQVAALTRRACPDVALPVTVDGQVRVTQLCLTGGGTAVTADGLLVPVTTSSGGSPGVYRISFLEAEFGPAVRVEVGEGVSQDLDVAVAAAHLVAGSHYASGPDAGGWRTVGDFPLPVGGVITTDATTIIGSCPESLLAGAGCSPVAPSVPVTVIAGTFTDPKDIVIGGPIASAPAGSIGLVATGDVEVANYSHLPGGALDVAAHLFAGGQVRATYFPAAPLGSLTVTGSVAGREVSGTLGAAPLTVQHVAPTAVMPAFSALWHPVAAVQIPAPW